LLYVSNLQVKFNHELILEDISFELKRNETLAIIGPNGAGKTTLFRALLGLIPYKGKVEWQKGIKIGYVPQRLSIEHDLPLTTEEFFTLKGKEIKNKEIETVLSIVGFEKDKSYQGHIKDRILNKKIGTLSGGELQRVLVAWALLDHPDVLLFDEPTAGIDISSEVTIYSLLHKLQVKEKLTILLISHELQLVYKYATNVICLNKQKVCYGKPKDVFMNENLIRLFGNDVGFYQHH
jgi:zinc transport system ATP-binding protein